MKYCNCGQLLLLSVEEGTVTLPTGLAIPFRRATDYVSCDQCFSSFAVTDLRGQPPPPAPRPPDPGLPERRRG